MADKCKRIIGHGINCFVNRQLIYNFPEQIFADAGVMAIEHADFDGIERLALVTGEVTTHVKMFEVKNRFLCGCGSLPKELKRGR